MEIIHSGNKYDNCDNLMDNCDNLTDKFLNNYNYWNILFDIKFDPESKVLNKQIIESFYDKIIRITNNNNEWNLIRNDLYLTYEHYFNISESKFILRMKSNSIDFYLICHNNKYIVCSDNNGIVRLITDLTLPEIFLPLQIPLQIPFIFDIDQVWNLDTKKIIEYSHSIMNDELQKKHYFYFIHHKNILEVYNGCHWIFETDKNFNYEYSRIIKISATSACQGYFEKYCPILPPYASEDIFNFQPGKLIYFASLDQMFAMKDDQVLIDVIFNRIENNIYKPELCDHIKKLGYDLSLNYNFIVHNKNEVPEINYISSKESKYFDKLECFMDIFYEVREYGYAFRSKNVIYSDYNYEIIVNYCSYENFKVMLKHNKKCVLSISFTNCENFKLSINILYFHENRFTNFIKTVPTCNEFVLFFDTVINDKKKIEGIMFVNDFIALMKNFNICEKEGYYDLSSLKYQYQDLKLFYDPHMKQYNLFKKYSSKVSDGGIISSNKETNNKDNEDNEDNDKNKEFEPKETNLKINLEDKKVIMNEKNGSLVEIDLYNGNSMPIKIGYKYGIVINNENTIKVLIELELPSDAKIVSGSDKNRTSKCIVKRIYDPNTGNNYNEAYGKYQTDFKYNLEDNIIIHNFPDNSDVCCHGIHFCHSIVELQQKNW